MHDERKFHTTAARSGRRPRHMEAMDGTHGRAGHRRASVRPRGAGAVAGLAGVLLVSVLSGLAVGVMAGVAIRVAIWIGWGS